MQRIVKNSLYTLHFVLNISTECICHSFVIVCRFLSGETKQAHVHQSEHQLLKNGKLNTLNYSTMFFFRQVDLSV